MSRLASLLHLDDGEFVVARAEQESKPLPQRTAPLPANWGRDMIAFLRVEAPVQPRTLGMRRPAAPTPTPAASKPLPSRSLIEYVTAVSTAIHADYEQHLDTLRVIDEISATLTEHPEFLTSAESHPGPRLWLRRIAAELDAQPELRHDHALLMHLAPVVAMLKGSVA